MSILVPKSHREAVALFRHQVIGSLICRTLLRGELKPELKRLSQLTFTPPGATASHAISVPTIERWLRAWRSGGLEALMPAPRDDRGRARALTPDQQQLVLDIRRDFPTASAELILRTLVGDGRLEKDTLSAVTLRRFFAQHGLYHAAPGRNHTETRQRLPWQMAQPNMLWHGDVCHGPDLGVGRKTRVRIHGLLDDASRYFIALEAHETEQELDMLGLFVGALRRHGRPDGLYLDNGSTYRGDTLAIACGRLSIGLQHARPYDPQARGKMERVWRTLRAQCLDFVTPECTLAEVNERLARFATAYHATPHSGLVGKTPEAIFAARTRVDQRLTETQLAEALTVVEKRRIRKDSTLSLDGVDYEVDASFLAGHIVVVKRCILPTAQGAWVEHDGRRLALRPVDAVANSHRKRATPTPPRQKSGVPFDPTNKTDKEGQ